MYWAGTGLCLRRIHATHLVAGPQVADRAAASGTAVRRVRTGGSGIRRQRGCGGD